MAIDSSRVCVILLAAGRAERFGADKLIQLLDGRPLAHHAAATLSAIAFAQAIAVTGAADLDLDRFGFRSVRAPQGAPMSLSIAHGIAVARDTGCDACLITLADMPFVPESHFRALLEAHVEGVTATGRGARPMVPAVFARDLFPALCALTGDRGAAALLAPAKRVAAEASWLQDVDTPADLAGLQRPGDGHGSPSS